MLAIIENNIQTMEQELKNQKISVSETLNSSFHLWKDNFITIALVITIVFIPVQIVIELVSIAVEHLREPYPLNNVEDLKHIANEARIFDFIRQLIGVIATLGIYNFIYCLYRNNNDDRNALELVKFGLRKWPENFGQTFIAGLITLLYSLLLIIPGIYKAVQFSFVSNLVADEESEPLHKSEILVKDKWFNVFGMALLIFLIGFIIELIVAIPFIILPDSFMATIILGVLAAIASSYTIVIKSVYYLKIKELKNSSIENFITTEENTITNTLCK